MKNKGLSISNIAWNSDENDAVLGILKKHSIGAIEVAPAKVVSNVQNFSDDEVLLYKEKMNDAGIVISSMQALLFGGPSGNIFGNQIESNAIQNHLSKIIHMAGLLGAEKLVFGSPKNRLRNDISFANAIEIAAKFFQPLAIKAKDVGTMICIEPNPEYYGCDFITDSKEAVELACTIDHPGFGVHLDLAGLRLSKEDVYNRIAILNEKIAHFHISEKDLAPIGLDIEAHNLACKGLEHIAYHGWLSIEMKRSEMPLVDIDASISLVKEIYGPILC
ncbi:TIM barrel protein [Citrobacter sp. HN-141]|uniref:sugar phosphate isomerase/epimerase family protein n=1 Tax=unclassified Citrobacter TaxID=2644389 RepID=UPI002964F0D5|nr:MULTISPECIES: TIM barrel protein [unclassified Citrobacter]MDW2644992.1 TIM barrel protein [Citrobacter sp. HN-141]MDW2654542.1 TIM barrel protein [Citrobacter sp. HN-120]MDW2697608.1 TIM barrel protein [Citrobacter sp. HN-144]